MRCRGAKLAAENGPGRPRSPPRGISELVDQRELGTA
jgi:hypothetical protein